MTEILSKPPAFDKKRPQKPADKPLTAGILSKPLAFDKKRPEKAADMPHDIRQYRVRHMISTIVLSEIEIVLVYLCDL